jgi:hypothetical protein
MKSDARVTMPSAWVISGNHKPSLRSVTEAARRRFNLIPFTVTIPPEEWDKGLSEKLEAESLGILAWMIEGCLAWQESGLAPPEAVTAATPPLTSMPKILSRRGSMIAANWMPTLGSEHKRCSQTGRRTPSVPATSWAIPRPSATASRAATASCTSSIPTPDAPATAASG